MPPPRILLAVVGSMLVVCAQAQQRTAKDPSAIGRALRPKAARAALPAGSDLFVATLGAWDFAQTDSNTSYAYTTLGGVEFVMAASGPGAITEMIASVHLPTGVLIDSFELDYCDLDAAQEIGVLFDDCADDAGGPGPCTEIGSAQTTGAPGCGYVNSGFIGATTDNVNHDYILGVLLPYPSTAGFRGIKIYYRLQVSPAPLTPTFNDVPLSDPAFQFIEAFAAAGITVGCQTSPPLYCPDGTVTRRQMAVFFAKALGLRWPG
jgi:hypothetical protein